jgi:hypothetical protein
VLGADTELRLRLAARGEPRDEFVARRYRRHVDLITSHAEGPVAGIRLDKGPRPYTAGALKGNVGSRQGNIY